MTWTYTNNPTGSTRDAVRFLLGDTDTTDQQMTDEEIAYLLAESGDDPRLAAARGARTLQAKYARLVTKSVGDLSISYSDRAKQYADLVISLESSANLLAAPFLGGMEVATKESRAADTSLVQPAFTLDSMKNNEH